MFLQLLWCLAGLLLAALLPVHLLEINNRAVKTCTVAFATLLLAFLPGLLPKYVVPTVGAQRRLGTLNYLLIALLFIINLFRH